MLKGQLLEAYQIPLLKGLCISAKHEVRLVRITLQVRMHTCRTTGDPCTKKKLILGTLFSIPIFVQFSS